MMQGRISLFSVAWKNVTRKLFRNIVVSVAVALLVSLLVFALLFNNTIQEDINQAAKKLGADMVVVPAEAMQMAEDFILESKEKTFYFEKFVYDEIVNIDEVEKATYQIYLNTIESECCSIVEGQVIIFDQHSDFIIKPWLQEKSLPDLQQGEVYIGSYVAEYLGLLSTLTLFGKDLHVAGELAETGIGLDHGLFVRMEDLDLTSEGVSGQYREGRISIIFIKLKNGTDPVEVEKKIMEINPRVGVITRANIGGGIKSTLEDILKIFSITIFVSSLMAILLAWSTFTALANERQREVGIIRAIGATRSHILSMFMSEAVIISLVGGFVGVFIGHYFLHHLAQDFELLTRINAISITSPKTILISIFSMLAGVVVCLVGALIPVLRLANMEPLLAIKED